MHALKFAAAVYLIVIGLVVLWMAASVALMALDDWARGKWPGTHR